VGNESARSSALTEHLMRTSAGRIVAHLTRRFGPERLDLAEDVVQEALVRALQRWPYDGVPENPAGWLFRTALRIGLDRLRRDAIFREKAALLEADLRHAQQEPDDPALDEALRDAELAMVFMCCHPALPRDARVALSLKIVGGFSVAEIARAFLADHATVAQRLVRAKRRLRALKVRLELPGRVELAPRLDAVLEVIYLLFNEGYAAHDGDDLVRPDLCHEALRLGRLLAASPMVGAPRVHALVALMAFHAARLPARVDEGGELVLLEDQDRRRWDAALIALGFQHLATSAQGRELSSYHLQAAIAAEHARARTAAETDWRTILELYDQLLAVDPSPIVALNRAVAVAKVEGPEAGLAILDQLRDEAALAGYHLLPAARGRLLEQIGDFAGAAACYREALACRSSAPERRFLARRLATCERLCPRAE
jgi:RNA polymerase sigma-70 factor (ECF subfamily)